jgi:hypothetical protein
LIAEHAEKMGEFKAKMDSINAKLLEIQRRPAIPDDRILVPELRAEFDRTMTASNALNEQTNQRVSALKALMRPNLPSA